jgi:hypothetical protein
MATFTLHIAKPLFGKDESDLSYYQHCLRVNIRRFFLSAAYALHISLSLSLSLSLYLICQCREYDDSRASIELSYGCAGDAPVNCTPENTNSPASKTVSADTESIMPLYLTEE